MNSLVISTPNVKIALIFIKSIIIYKVCSYNLPIYQQCIEVLQEKNALGNHTLPAFELHAGTTGCPIIKEIKVYTKMLKILPM